MVVVRPPMRVRLFFTLRTTGGGTAVVRWAGGWLPRKTPCDDLPVLAGGMGKGRESVNVRLTGGKSPIACSGIGVRGNGFHYSIDDLIIIEI